MRHHLIALLVISMAFTTADVSAGIVSTSGAIEVIPAPGDVRDERLESDARIVAFAELQDIVLISDLNVNVSVAGTSPSSPNDDNLSPIAIPAGTGISSYFLHCDAIGNQSPAREFMGSITFSTDVLGLAFLNPQLNQRHDYPGLADTRYSTIGAMEINSTPAFDSITLSDDRRTVTVHFRNSNAPDDVRIITAAVPEPTSVVILALGAGAPAIGRCLRRSKGRAT